MNRSAECADTIRIFVNDRPRELPATTSIAALLDELGLSQRKGVAAAHNGVVVPRKNWPTCRLTEGDRVLVIQATQGG